jgi:hypothetical protein
MQQRCSTQLLLQALAMRTRLCSEISAPKRGAEISWGTADHAFDAGLHQHHLEITEWPNF